MFYCKNILEKYKLCVNKFGIERCDDYPKFYIFVKNGGRINLNIKINVLNTMQTLRKINNTKYIVAVLGCGHMGGTLVSGSRLAAATQPSFRQRKPLFDIVCSDINKDRRKQMQQFDVKMVNNNVEAVHNSDLVILAVPPDAARRVCEEIKSELPDSVTVLSIVAGLKLSGIRKHTGVANVIRAVPNQPCAIREGVTVWTSEGTIPHLTKALVQNLFSDLGIAIEVENETVIDIATSITGCGPAYTLLFIDALTNTAVELGLERSFAKNLAINTILGTCNHVLHERKDPMLLASSIVTPGGATAAALSAADRTGFRFSIGEMVRSAYSKCKRLGNLQE